MNRQVLGNPDGERLGYLVSVFGITPLRPYIPSRNRHMGVGTGHGQHLEPRVGFSIACDDFLSGTSGLLPHTRLCNFGFIIYVVNWIQKQLAFSADSLHAVY